MKPQSALLTVQARVYIGHLCMPYFTYLAMKFLRTPPNFYNIIFYKNFIKITHKNWSICLPVFTVDHFFLQTFTVAISVACGKHFHAR